MSTNNAVERGGDSRQQTVSRANRFSPNWDLEEGVDEHLNSGYRLWASLVSNTQSLWDSRLRALWIRTLLFILILHPTLCLLGELIWLYSFESYSASDIQYIISSSSWYPSPNANIAAQLLRTPALVLEKFYLEFCIFPFLVFIVTIFMKTLRNRLKVCAQVCTISILDPLKLGDAVFSTQPACTAQVEDAFCRKLQNLQSHHTMQESVGLETSAVTGAPNIFRKTTLYDPAFCAFIHCPLVALVCFLKFSMVSLFISAPGLKDDQLAHTPLSSARFILSLIFGLVYSFSILAVAVIWSLLAYHQLSTEDEIWGHFLKDLDTIPSSHL
ncbi:hypothetical protein BDP27DRAFT_1316845, partial [Rhodocollybia butyracea]